MRLPKFTDKHRRKRQVLKICQLAGCGVEYIGAIHSKYCMAHRNPNARPHERLKVQFLNNQKIVHSFAGAKNAIMVCALAGCSKEFNVDSTWSICLPKVLRGAQK